MSVNRKRRLAIQALTRCRMLAPLMVLFLALAACQPAAAPAPANPTQPPTVPATATQPQAVATPTLAPTALPVPATVVEPTPTSSPAPAPSVKPTAIAIPTATTAPTTAATAVPPSPAPAPTLTAAPAASVAPSPTPSSAASTGQTAGALATTGRQVYVRCAACHGPAGEGAYGPALIGTGAKLAARGNAQALFDYIHRDMPQDAPGTLTTQQYLEVTAFLLLSNNYVQANDVLAPGNLAAISLNR